MNKEKWKDLSGRLSTGFRKFSIRTVMVVIAAFAMVGVASMVEFSNDTIVEYLNSRDEEKQAATIKQALGKAIGEHEQYLATTVLQYAYTKVENLGTQTVNYTARSTYEDYRGIGNFTLPGTRKSIEVECPGSITAYYRPTDVTWKTDSGSRVIYVTLPETVYVENNLYEEEMTRVDTDNFLNRIKEKDLETCKEKLKAAGLAQAVEDGLYELVSQSAKETISDVFAVLENYGVSFESAAVLKNSESDGVVEDQPDIVETEPEEAVPEEAVTEEETVPEDEEAAGQEPADEESVDTYPGQDLFDVPGGYYENLWGENKKNSWWEDFLDGIRDYNGGGTRPGWGFDDSGGGWRP